MSIPRYLRIALSKNSLFLFKHGGLNVFQPPGAIVPTTSQSSSSSAEERHRDRVWRYAQTGMGGMAVGLWRKKNNIILKTTSPIEFVSNRVTSDSTKNPWFSNPGKNRRPSPDSYRQVRWHEGLDPSGSNGSTVPQRGRFDREWLPGMSGT